MLTCNWVNFTEMPLPDVQVCSIYLEYNNYLLVCSILLHLHIILFEFHFQSSLLVNYLFICFLQIYVLYSLKKLCVVDASMHVQIMAIIFW